MFEKTQEIVARVDPSMIAGLVVAFGGVLVVFSIYTLVRLLQRIPFIRRWGEARKMHRARQRVLDEYLSDGICDFVEGLRMDKKIRPEEAESLYRRCARHLNLPDLLPQKSADTVKTGIRERIRLGWYSSKSPIPEPKEEPAKELKSVWNAI